MNTPTPPLWAYLVALSLVPLAGLGFPLLLVALAVYFP